MSFLAAPRKAHSQSRIPQRVVRFPLRFPVAANTLALSVNQAVALPLPPSIIFRPRISVFFGMCADLVYSVASLAGDWFSASWKICRQLSLQWIKAGVQGSWGGHFFERPWQPWYRTVHWNTQGFQLPPAWITEILLLILISVGTFHCWHISKHCPPGYRWALERATIHQIGLSTALYTHWCCHLKIVTGLHWFSK